MSRLPLLGAGALTASPPAFLAYRGAPWWALLLTSLIAALFCALGLVLAAIIPQDSRDRLELWRGLAGARRAAGPGTGRGPAPRGER